MDRLVFVTNNPHKLEEVKEIIEGENLYSIKIISLGDIGCTEEIAETSSTLEGNASQKAFYIYNKYGVDCFADDTGLEVEALDGKPGVYSARYAGEEKDADKNMNKVLDRLSKSINKKARFRTVISLIINGKEKIFEGIVNGVIINEKRGKQGFGYDPVFLPEGYTQTLAEMPLELKNKISHRFHAVRRMIGYLKR